ncbi:MAG: hypothetical protein CL609_08640 [Anaerolineaceae bacterium]|nr:hypothetical protein [Anaerolineaceae bacterium]
MKIYYANASLTKNDIRGRSVHIRQFTNHSLQLGHEIWMNQATDHPGIQYIPSDRLQRLKLFRKMDVIYVRLQGKITGACKYTTLPYRLLFGNPINVWEFNTYPILSFSKKLTEAQKQQKLNRFRELGRHCDLAVCVSEKLSEFVQEHLSIKNTIVIPNGSDPVLFDPDLYKNSVLENVNSEQFNVLWMGSAELSWNDFDQLVNVVRILNKRGYEKHIAFHVIGSIDLDIKDIPPNIFCHGKIQYENLPQWLAKMDLGLIVYKPGSADYNSPLKLFDYLSSEMAVVSNEQPQVREVLSKINAEDLICAYGDSEEMANKIESLVNQPERVRRLGDQGRKLVINYYNWERAVRKTYDQILEIKNNQGGFLWKTNSNL